MAASTHTARCSLFPPNTRPRFRQPCQFILPFSPSSRHARAAAARSRWPRPRTSSVDFPCPLVVTSFRPAAPAASARPAGGNLVLQHHCHPHHHHTTTTTTTSSSRFSCDDSFCTCRLHACGGVVVLVATPAAPFLAAGNGEQSNDGSRKPRHPRRGCCWRHHPRCPRAQALHSRRAGRRAPRSAHWQPLA